MLNLGCYLGDLVFIKPVNIFQIRDSRELTMSMSQILQRDYIIVVFIHVHVEQSPSTAYKSRYSADLTFGSVHSG